eukprot:CFRG1742T1
MCMFDYTDSDRSTWYEYLYKLVDSHGTRVLESTALGEEFCSISLQESTDVSNSVDIKASRLDQTDFYIHAWEGNWNCLR